MAYEVERLILLIRGQRVMLDADLARIFGVSTKRLNEQVQRNLERFPEDFMFQLSVEEKAEVVANCDHLKGLKYSPYAPRVFTEHGAIMLASALNSAIAVQASVQIVRAFVRLRAMLANNFELARRLDALEKRYDVQFKTVFAAIRELMITPKEPPRRMAFDLRVLRPGLIYFSKRATVLKLMVYGVFSDVHANLEALTAVLDFFEDFEVDGYICCGDIVGYGPQPEETVARLRKLKNLHCIIGNHDLAVVGMMDVEWFNPYAKAAALWSRDALSFESKRWIQGLTAKSETKDFTAVHGTPRKPPEEYLLSAAQFKDNMPLVHVWPLFVGHSHMPLCFRVNKDEPLGIETMILEDHQQVEIQRMPYGIVPTAFNPGSVGQPRDQDKRASCGLYDSGKGTFRIIRLNYDIAGVQNKIRAAGLPEFLALRLAFGQ